MDTSSSPEIACTLTPDQLRDRREELLPGLFQRADQVTNLPHGLRLHFSHRPGLLTEISRVIEQERTCCSFLNFQISVAPNVGPITLEVTGPAGTREMLRAL